MLRGKITPSEALQELVRRGFDGSTIDGLRVRVKCSQCAALAINGVACHETGCPNQTHPCAECGDWITRRARLCYDCANPEPEPTDDDPQPYAIDPADRYDDRDA